MGTFAETANVDYRLSFANPGKQTSVFSFPFAENRRKFAVFVSCLQQMKVPYFISSVFRKYIETAG
jgi:hypothetical protein